MARLLHKRGIPKRLNCVIKSCFATYLSPCLPITHRNPKSAHFWLEFGLQTENRDDTGSLEVLNAPLGLLSDLALKDIFFRTFSGLYSSLHWCKCRLRDAELWRAPQTLSTDAPCTLRSPPVCPLAAVWLISAACWCCWMLHGGAAQIQLRIWGWRREDSGRVGSE